MLNLYMCMSIGLGKCITFINKIRGIFIVLLVDTLQFDALI